MRVCVSKIGGNGGFTLIELMIAAVILFVALILALEASSNLNQGNELAHQTVIALEDAHRTIESMRKDSATGTFPGNVVAKYPAGQPIQGFNTLNGEQVVPTYVSTTANPLNITITVTWNAVTKTSGTRVMSTQVTTLMTKR